MLYVNNSSISCGVVQVSELQGAHVASARTVRSKFRGAASILFSDACINGNGKKFAKRLKEMGYQVVKSKIVTNPGSGNKIETWIATRAR
jgi:hypothetical protein